MESGKYLLASLSDSMRFWDIEVNRDPTIPLVLPFTKEMSCLSWNHTNQVIAVGGDSPFISLIEASNGNLVSTIPFSDVGINPESTITSLTFGANSRFLASSSSNSLLLWDMKKRQLKFHATHRGVVTSMAFLPDGEIVAGDSIGTLIIWDIKNNQSSKELIYRENVPITSIQISTATSPKIATGYADGSLCIYDPNTLDRIRHQVAHREKLTSLSYSPKNPRLISTCGLDGRITLIDTSSKNSTAPSAVIDIGGERLLSLSFHQDAIHCAVGTQSGQIYLYDWRNVRKPIFQISDASIQGVDGKGLISPQQITPVKCVLFQNPIKSNKSSNPPAYSYATTPSKSPLKTASTKPTASTSLINSKNDSIAKQLNFSLDSTATQTLSIQEESERLNNIEVIQQNSNLTIKPPLIPPTSQQEPKEITVSQKNLATESPIPLSTQENSEIYKKNLITTHPPPPPPLPSSPTSFSTSPSFSTPIASSPHPTPTQFPFSTLLTKEEFQASLELLKYDIHRETQQLIREQARQFEIAKIETSNMIKELTNQLSELLNANKELREENEKLRRIY